MLITKVIEVGIDVQNTINLYTDDDNIKHILEDRFEGKCFRGCWIKSINKILRIGECVINQDGVPNFGTIPVIVEVSAVVYAVGEIINGCTVVSKDKSGVIICTTDIASIILNAHKALESITKGQIISVRVAAIKYNQGAGKISIGATPFLFQDRPIIYKIGPITEGVKEMLNNVLERIAYEEAEMSIIKKEKLRAWETFDQFLYAYKDEQKPPAGAKVLNIIDIAKNGVTNISYLSRDNRINLSTPNVYGYATTTFPPGSILRTELPTANVLIILLEDYCSHLRTIREMIEIYSTEELLLAHKNLWQIFKKNKM